MAGIKGTFDRDLFITWLRERINDGKRELEEISLRQKAQSEVIKVIPIGDEQRMPNGLRCVASEIEREAAFYAQQVGEKTIFLVCAHYVGLKRPLGSFAFALETDVKQNAEEREDEREERSLLMKIIKDQHVAITAMAMHVTRANETVTEELRRGYGELAGSWKELASESRAMTEAYMKDARDAHEMSLSMRIKLEETLNSQEERDEKRRRRETGEKLLGEAYKDLKKHGPALLTAIGAGKVPLGDVKNHPTFVGLKSVLESLTPEQQAELFRILRPDQTATLGSLVKYFQDADQQNGKPS